MNNFELMLETLKDIVTALETLPEKRKLQLNNLPPDIIAEIDQLRARIRDFHRV